MAKKAKAKKEQTQDHEVSTATMDDAAEGEGLTSATVEQKKGSKPAPDIIIKDRFVTRTVAGLAFWPSWPEKKLKQIHKGIQAWVDAGKPNDAYIYDTLDNLVTCGVPMKDVKMVNGLAVRMPPRKPEQARVNIAYAVSSKPPEVKKTIKEIRDADTKQHHAMAYG